MCRVYLTLLQEEALEITRMVKSKPLSHRERREASLLLNVVFAHMAVSSAKNDEDRERAHGDFAQAVRMLYCFMNSHDNG